MTADYVASLEAQARLGDCLPPEHLARSVVDTIEVLDLSAIAFDRRAGATNTG